MIGDITNHLWQSTLFVVAAGLVAAALRKNGAHVRHRVWLVASLKFLVPFSILMSLGGALPRITPARTTAIATSGAPDLSVTVDRIAQPFTSDVFLSSTPVATMPAATNWAAIVLLGIWACGVVVVAFMRVRDWRRIRAAMRMSAPVRLAAPIPVRSSPGLLEPGVVGLFRPVLLVPAGIEANLTPAQLNAVLAHELCHVERRDNLTSAIHMVVEAAFWFHPLVWWVGARLVDERERACDEHVLRVCGEPAAYAESILNVCKLYVESPLACVSGVIGSDLKKRIAAIMVNRIGLQLNLARKVTLAMAALLAIVLPLVAGMLTAPLRASAFAAIQGAATAGQAPAQRFDVVSIKPWDPNAPSTGGGAAPPGLRRGGAPWQAQVSPGYAHWDCVTLAQLVDQAYADRDHPLLNTIDRPRPELFQPKRVRGGPSWSETDKFTIETKASLDVTNPGLAGSSSRYLATLPETMSLALRAVLEDRFQAKVHRATEQQHMYALTIAKAGLNKEKMVAPTPGDCLTPAEYAAAAAAGQVSRSNDPKICGQAFMLREGGMELSSFTLQQLAAYLSTRLDRFVLDRTGVESKFNFVLKPDYSDNLPGDGPLVRALETLGLKFEPTKGPAEYLVIDHAERPTPDGPAPSRAIGARRR